MIWTLFKSLGAIGAWYKVSELRFVQNFVKLAICRMVNLTYFRLHALIYIHMIYVPTYVLCNTIVVLTIEKPGRVVVELCSSSVHCAGQCAGTA